jgi:hypothetical protein
MGGKTFLGQLNGGNRRVVFSHSAGPRSAFRRFQRGQASLELLLVFIILIPLLFGAIEISRAVAVRAALDSGVGVAVRALSVDPNNVGWANDVVVSTVGHNVFGTAGLGPISVTKVDSGGNTIQDEPFKVLQFGTLFCVRGSVEYTPQVPLISLDKITIRVEHCGVIERVG